MIKTINLTLTLTLIFLGCTPKTQTVQTPTSTTTANSIVEEEAFTHVAYSVNAQEAYKMIQNDPNLFILDVRTPQEIPMDGKIANSVMIPVQVLGQYLHRLDKSKTILVYCHTGNRSLVATQILNDNKFKVVNMAGGINSWSQMGFPTEK